MHSSLPAILFAFADIDISLDKDGNIDFKKPQNVQTLTKALLKRDFGLQMILPDDRLCPPVRKSMSTMSFFRIDGLAPLTLWEARCCRVSLGG